MVFLENFYGFLLLVHLFATFVLVGSMTHNRLCVIGYMLYTNSTSGASSKRVYQIGNRN